MGKRRVTVKLPFVVAGITAVLALASPLRAADRLEGAAIKDAVSGKRVYLSVPLGGEFPLYYKVNGQVDGTGQALGLGKYLKPTDSGRWWVDGAKLCQKWQSWYDGKVFCFTLERTGPQQLAWTRDDGYSGTARIGN